MRHNRFFINELQPYIETALDYTPHIILVGDINIDFNNLSNNLLKDCLSLFNFTNVIKEPTRVVLNTSSLIDPIIVSDTCSVLDSGVIIVDEFISDHRATYVSLKIPFEISTCYWREVWNYKNADYHLLNDLIEDYDWNLIINDTVSVDEAAKNFTGIFIDFCRKCIPCKKVLIRPNDKPWFSSKLRYNIRLRDRLRKRAFTTQKENDFKKYKIQRNHVNNMKKFAKENYNNNIDEILTNDV